MYSVKKFYSGIHRMDNGQDLTGAGFAVVNEDGQIVTSIFGINEFAHVAANLFDYKFAAQKQADYLNRKGGN